MTNPAGATLKVSTPSDREIVVTRAFDAPRDLVFEAWTKPEHVRHWWGWRSSTMVYGEAACAACCAGDGCPRSAYRAEQDVPPEGPDIPRADRPGAVVHRGGLAPEHGFEP